MILSCCFKQAEDVKVLDFRHCGLSQVPNSVFNAERTIESLHIDANQIKSLPRELFHCHGLRHFTLSDNEITSIPPAISSLVNVEQLDLSKNGILELPDNLKSLKYLQHLDASVNPLGRLPDGFTQLLNLTHVHLNDCFLEYLPGNFGRLSKLRILELRENHMKTLPKSMGRLIELERLDIGCNEFIELPDVVGSLSNLLELWCDSNQITAIPAVVNCIQQQKLVLCKHILEEEIGQLKQLMYFDACKNRIEELPAEIDGCSSLSDLHLSTNLLKYLPQSIGRLSNMTTLKVDDNQLLALPASIGGLVSLSELDASANDLVEIPPTIGLLRHLRTLIADENFLSDVPCELGSCSGLTVLSVRSNKLTYLPDEIGRIPRLRMLNLSDNEIKVLPYSLMNLKELQALWLAENQSKPLIRLQSEIDSETGRRSLTCYLLPQQRMDPVESMAEEDKTSFHPSLWDEQRQQRQQIHFEDNQSSHDAGAAPYPKEQRVRTRHVENQVVRRITDGDLPGVDDVPPGTPNKKDSSVMLGANNKLPGSPRNSTHRLVKLEKERIAKDKARINRHSQEVSSADLEETPLGIELTERHTNQSNSVNGNFDQQDTAAKNSPKPIHLRNSIVRSHSTHSQNGPATRAENSLPPPPTHSHSRINTPPVAPNAFTVDNLSDLPAPPPSHADDPPSQQPDSTTIPNKELKLTSNAQLNTSSAGAESSAKISSGHSSSTAVNQAEAHYGVFASEEDPKVYQQRFKYYQRMKKHRRSNDVHSDLGYYGKYTNSSQKTSSDSGHRRPLLHGRDGYSNDPLETYTNRSVGDGYASDIEGNHKVSTGSAFPLIPNHMQSPYRPVDLHKPGAESGSRSTVNNEQRQHNMTQGSKTSIDNRPPVPPNYESAMASRGEVREVENTPFPPPPPYKPPVRDMKPDGASNDGVPSLSPNDDHTHHPPHQEGTTPVPFRSYTEISQRNGDHKPITKAAMPKLGRVNSGNVKSQSGFNNVAYTPTKQIVNSSQHMNGSVRTSERIYASGGALHQVQQHGSLPRQRNDSHQQSDAQKQKPPRLVTPVWHTLAHGGKSHQSHNYNQQSTPNLHRNNSGQHRGVSYYSSVYQPDEANENEYMEQISKSFGNLGYRKDGSRAQVKSQQQFYSPRTQHRDSRQRSSAVYQTLPNQNQNYAPARTELYGSSHQQEQMGGPPVEHINHGYQQQTVYETNTPMHSTPHARHSASIHASGYMPPPNRKSPRLPQRFQHQPEHINQSQEVFHPPETDSHLYTVTIVKNPGLGFSVAGGIGSQGNPFKPMDEGIFVTKVTPNGPASNILQAGDKIVRLNEHSLAHLEHSAAVQLLKQSPPQVTLTIERMMPTTV